MIKSRTMLIVAILALIGAIGIIAYILKRGPATVVPTEDMVVVTGDGTWPSDEIRQEKIDQTEKGHQITAVYPITQSTAVSAYFRTFVEDNITRFKEDTSWTSEINNAEAEIVSLDVTYTRQKSTTVDNYIFHVNSYTGGAHGLQVTKTFSFTPEGKPLTIAGIFTNGVDGLKTIAPYVQKELLKLDFTEKQWVEEGAAPDELNYQNFVVDEKGITFIFDP
ncbi:RsiV family protein, partial [Patescibacteria group bacterium]|nr:RsiV family protein [Patescibacteria group bacterium]